MILFPGSSQNGLARFFAPNHQEKSVPSCNPRELKKTTHTSRITHKSFLSEIAEMLGAYRLKRNPDLLEKFSKKMFVHKGTAIEKFHSS